MIGVVPRLYVVADRGIFRTDEEWLDALADVARAIADRPDMGLQVRAKVTGPARRAHLATRARAVLARAGGQALLDRSFLNGTTSEAIASGYSGAHWPEVTIPTEPDPQADRLVVAASIHSVAALVRAEAAGAHFVLFGPVFDPGSKPGRGVGLEALRRVASGARVPVVAIGGIAPAHVGPCLRAGAVGVAVVTGILRAPDPALAIADYLAAIGDAAGGGHARRRPVPSADADRCL